MIRERRVNYHRQQINQAIHIHKGSWFCQHYPEPTADSIHQQIPINQKQNNSDIRGGLIDLINYSNAPLGLDVSSMFIKPSNFIVQDKKYQRGYKCKGKENIYNKIELIRNEEVGTPTCHSSRSKQLKRPLTSVSQHTRRSMDQSACHKGHLVLHIKHGEFDEQPADNERVSTSRALMNFSKVYKNASIERFKVKKNTSLMPRFAQLSAQKIVFQQKIKKQKQLKGRSSLGNSQNKRRKLTKANRYVEPQQQFEIGGWGYFD